MFKAVIFRETLERKLFVFASVIFNSVVFADIADTSDAEAKPV
jgi:hypothetical protein